MPELQFENYQTSQYFPILCVCLGKLSSAQYAMGKATLTLVDRLPIGQQAFKGVDDMLTQ